jgi:TPR repeat protein
LAESWWEKAAAGGEPWAMFELGVLANEAGDTASVRTWWEQAAELGGPDAVEALGQSN